MKLQPDFVSTNFLKTQSGNRGTVCKQGPQGLTYSPSQTITQTSLDVMCSVNLFLPGGGMNENEITETAGKQYVNI